MKISKTFSKKAKDFSSSKSKCLFFMPAFVRAFLFKSSPNGELSYKGTNSCTSSFFSIWAIILLTLAWPMPRLCAARLKLPVLSTASTVSISLSVTMQNPPQHFCKSCSSQLSSSFWAFTTAYFYIFQISATLPSSRSSDNHLKIFFAAYLIFLFHFLSLNQPIFLLDPLQLFQKRAA